MLGRYHGAIMMSPTLLSSEVQGKLDDTAAVQQLHHNYLQQRQ